MSRGAGKKDGHVHLTFGTFEINDGGRGCFNMDDSVEYVVTEGGMTFKPAKPEWHKHSPTMKTARAILTAHPPPKEVLDKLIDVAERLNKDTEDFTIFVHIGC